MTAKQIITNPLVLTIAALAVVAIVIWYNYDAWFGEGSRKTIGYCQCTHTGDGKCGRDQYCDGCNCVNDTNRIQPVTYYTPRVVVTSVPPPPPPPPPTGDTV